MHGNEKKIEWGAAAVARHSDIQYSMYCTYMHSGTVSNFVARISTTCFFQVEFSIEIQTVRKKRCSRVWETFSEISAFFEVGTIGRVAILGGSKYFSKRVCVWVTVRPKVARSRVEGGKKVEKVDLAGEIEKRA